MDQPKGPVRENEHKAAARHPSGKVSDIANVIDFYSQRDPGLQHKVLYWIIDIMGEGPRGKTDFDHWIQEPTVLARVNFSACSWTTNEVTTGNHNLMRVAHNDENVQ